MKYILSFTLISKEGAVDQFDEHSDLNQCDQFDMKHSPGTQIRMTVFHEGNWKGAFITGKQPIDEIFLYIFCIDLQINLSQGVTDGVETGSMYIQTKDNINANWAIF